MRTSWGRSESTSQGRPLNLRLRPPLGVISGRPQDVRLRRPLDVRSGRSNRIFRGCPGDVGGERPRDVLGANICRLVICDEEYIWNPSNCKCERDKSCNFGEYLDYENCKCRNRLVDKLIEERDENIEERSLVKINSKKCKHNSYILYIVLFSIFFTSNIGIATYFVYYKYINHNKENVSVYDYVYHRKNYYIM